MTKLFCDVCKKENSETIRFRIENKLHDMCPECRDLIRSLVAGSGSTVRSITATDSPVGQGFPEGYTPEETWRDQLKGNFLVPRNAIYTAGTTATVPLTYTDLSLAEAEEYLMGSADSELSFENAAPVPGPSKGMFDGLVWSKDKKCFTPLGTITGFAVDIKGVN